MSVIVSWKGKPLPHRNAACKNQGGGHPCPDCGGHHSGPMPSTPTHEVHEGRVLQFLWCGDYVGVVVQTKRGIICTALTDVKYERDES